MRSPGTGLEIDQRNTSKLSVHFLEHTLSTRFPMYKKKGHFIQVWKTNVLVLCETFSLYSKYMVTVRFLAYLNGILMCVRIYTHVCVRVCMRMCVVW